MLVSNGAIRVFATRFRPSIVLSIAMVVIVALSTFFGGDAVGASVTEMFIRMVMVVGLYIFVGNSGIVSFGHMGFACLGAYAAGWASAEPTFKQIMLTGLPSFLQTTQYSFPVAMIGSALVPALVALILGAGIMRLSGIAASIATFAFLIIVKSVYSSWDSVTAGLGSIIGIPTVVGPWTAMGFALLAIVVANAFQVSRHGVMLRASHNDEVAAKASAVNVVRMKLIAFVLSAAIAGLGGGLYAHLLGILAVDVFYLNLTFITLAMLVVGGMGSLTGAVSGVVAVTVVVEVLRLFERGVSLGFSVLALPPGSQEIGLGITMALILILRPTGLCGNLRFEGEPKQLEAQPGIERQMDTRRTDVS